MTFDAFHEYLPIFEASRYGSEQSLAVCYASYRQAMLAMHPLGISVSQLPFIAVPQYRDYFCMVIYNADK
jgi:hypothetical protein